ncbi:MAG: hypothetical protein ABR589_05500 [Chthoniobacterales bacterium]
MSAEELEALQQARPFQPFDICLQDGRIIHVARPDLIRYLRQRNVFQVQQVLDGAGAMIDPAHILRIETSRDLPNTDEAMTMDQIRNLAHATPFVPFEIELVGGRLIHVAHPDFLAMDPGGLTLTVYELPNAGEFIDVKLILSLKIRRVEEA